MILTAEQIYHKLVDDYKIVGVKGCIEFSLKDISIEIKSKDSVGNLMQEWLYTWMSQNGIEFEKPDNSQKFPDLYINPTNHKTGLLEIKSFNYNKGPGFDIANFLSYCNSLLEASYRLDSDYLILAYQMSGSEIMIKNIWLKKVWEITGGSGPYLTLPRV